MPLQTQAHKEAYLSPMKRKPENYFWQGSSFSRNKDVFGAEETEAMWPNDALFPEQVVTWQSGAAQEEMERNQQGGEI